jgi:small subunit ribosomal protein S8
MVNDTIADLLTRIRNAQRAHHKSVRVQKSKASRLTLEVLKKEGFIQSYADKTDGQSPFGGIEVALKYYSSGEPLIGQAKRVSKPGKRVYATAENLPKIFSGLGISIVSTSQGVMSDREARKRGIGGEVWASIG